MGRLCKDITQAFKGPVLGLPRLHRVSFFPQIHSLPHIITMRVPVYNFTRDTDGIRTTSDNLIHHKEQTGPPRLVVKGYTVDCWMIKDSWPLIV